MADDPFTTYGSPDETIHPLIVLTLKAPPCLTLPELMRSDSVVTMGGSKQLWAVGSISAIGGNQEVFCTGGGRVGLV